MSYDFHTLVDRKAQHSVKWSLAETMNYPEDILPLWVADMDFVLAPAIQAALTRSLNDCVLGYTIVSEHYVAAVQHWFSRNHAYSIPKESLITMGGVVQGISSAILAFTQINDGILIQTPVYHPFRNTIVAHQRKVVHNSLVLANGRYEIDFADFEEKIINEQVKMFILCNPHNPGGRVWTRDELIRMCDICIHHNVLIIADEIHSDFIYPGYHHTMVNSLSPAVAQNTILCTAPSKSFNLAGLQIANIIVENSELRKTLKKTLESLHIPHTNTMGLIACEAAYREGQEWFDQLMIHLQENIARVRSYLQTYLPDIKLIEPEGTYLLWLDFRALQLSHEALNHWLIHDARLWFNDGAVFGKEGIGFQRMNIATTSAIIEEALQRLSAAVETLKKGNHPSL